MSMTMSSCLHNTMAGLEYPKNSQIWFPILKIITWDDNPTLSRTLSVLNLMTSVSLVWSWHLQGCKGIDDYINIAIQIIDSALPLEEQQCISVLVGRDKSYVANIISNLVINIRENRRGDQKWTIQRHRQHWTHKTKDEDNKNIIHKLRG